MSVLEVFDYAGHQVRTVLVDGEPWFVAADVTRALGLGNGRDAVNRLDQDGVGNADVIDSMGRTQVAKIVSEAGLYELVFQSRVAGAVEFKRWVTHDVLPALRKTGRYGSDVEMLAALPSSKLLALAAEAAERAEVLEAKVAADAPKVLFADAVASSSDSILVRALANILRQNGLDIGQNRLYERLRAEGYLCSSGESWNRPTQRAMDLGLFEVIERTVQGPEGVPSVTLTTKVTGKGQQYFVDRYTKALVAS